MNRSIEVLQKRLKAWKVDTLIIENPIDLFYLTQFSCSRGRLVVQPMQAVLMVDGRYFEAAKQKAKCSVTLWTKGSEEKLKGHVGFDGGFTTVANLRKLQAEHPEAEWISIDQPIKEQRLIKSDDEIAIMKRAAKLTWRGIEYIQTKFREGISELELAQEFEFYVRKNGASRAAFEPIVAFGENSAHPHHRASNDQLKNNQIILIDVGVVLDQYCSDVTRVFFFGDGNPELKKMFDLVRAAEKAARNEVKAKTAFGVLDQRARSVFASAGVEELYTHSLGHGIGLEAHEAPSIRFDGDDKNLEIAAGMVFTIEPGLYRPGLGGIRYENTGVVTKNGFESFYPDR